jgi:hypothetical protein
MKALMIPTFSLLVSVLTLELDDFFFLDRNEWGVIYLGDIDLLASCLFSVPQAAAPSHGFCGHMNPFY